MNKYLAFISYRHQPESLDAAVRIRKGLEGHHLPADCPLPKHRKVFRDTDELPTSTDLGTDIENALHGSGYLIALCTEEYVHSRWCLREVGVFLELGRRDRILPVLVTGTPETSMPKELQELPLAADLRNTAPGGTGSYDRKKVKAAIPLLLSRMAGMEADRIAQAEFRYRAVTAAAAVIFVAAGLLGFAGYATSTAKRISDNNTQIAAAMEDTEKAEQQALAERDTALLRQAEYLSEQAMQALADEDYDQAIGIALSALPEDLHGDLPVSAEAEGVLRLALCMDLPPAYRFLRAAETEFDITGYYLHSRQPDKILLEEECFGTSVPYVDYTGKAGIVETDFAESRQKALDLGYTKVWYLAGDASSRRHFYYGAGKPMFSESTLGLNHTDYTLQQEPFCPEYLLGNTSENHFIAWEETGDGRIPRMALFNNGKSEATAELKLSGIPVSVNAASNGSYILVVDKAGTLGVYDFEGVCRKTIAGNYTEAFYYYDAGVSCACTGSEDGTVSVLDLDSFEEILRFRCPSPVREIRMNRNINCMLVRCDGGVYLYHFKTGRLISEVGENAAPKFALWKDDTGNGSADASFIVLIYDRRVEIYAMDTETDSSIAEYHPLIKDGVPPGHALVYSQDGQRIYQHSVQSSYTYEPGEDMLYCWDAHTGELLWESANPEYCYESTFALSADGKTVWRIYEERTTLGVERLDGTTGKKLYSVHWDGEFWQPLEGYPTESKDGTKAWLLTQYSSTNSYNRSEVCVLFDPRTGELLKRMDLDEDSASYSARKAAEAEGADAEEASGENGEMTDTAGSAIGTDRIRPEERSGFAEVMLSADETCFYMVQNATRKESGISGVCIDRMDAATGEILDERFLELGEQKFTLWEEEEALVLIDEQKDEFNNNIANVYTGGVWIYPSHIAEWNGSTVTHTIRIIDLAGKRPAAVAPFSYRRSPEILNTMLRTIKPFDGGMALYWEAENADGDGECFCCRLYPDGTTGPVFPSDSGSGRRLWVEKDKYMLFNGQEAYFSPAGIRRLSDGTLLLADVRASSGQKIKSIADRPDSYSYGTDHGIAASKDGQSICMYSPYSGSTTTYPVLILPSDLDTLVQKGKRRIGKADGS